MNPQKVYFCGLFILNQTGYEETSHHYAQRSCAHQLRGPYRHDSADYAAEASAKRPFGPPHPSEPKRTNDAHQPGHLHPFRRRRGVHRVAGAHRPDVQRHHAGRHLRTQLLQRDDLREDQLQHGLYQQHPGHRHRLLSRLLPALLFPTPKQRQPGRLYQQCHSGIRDAGTGTPIRRFPEPRGQHRQPGRQP